MVRRIEKFYEKVLNKKDEGQEVGYMLRRLDAENAKSPFVDFKMQGEVQSYDLLQNDKYGRLETLKNMLEDF